MKTVSVYNNQSLKELRWDSKEPLALMNNEKAYLSFPEKLVMEKLDEEGFGFSMNFKENYEEWVLYPHGMILCLKAPKINEGGKTFCVPDVSYLDPCEGIVSVNPIEKVCSGKEEIGEMIKESACMKYYYPAFNSGKLILGRNNLEKTLENWGFEMFLRNPVRFKGI